MCQELCALGDEPERKQSMIEDQIASKIKTPCKEDSKRTLKDFPKLLSARACTAVNGKAEKAKTPSTSGIALQVWLRSVRAFWVCPLNDRQLR